MVVFADRVKRSLDLHTFTYKCYNLHIVKLDGKPLYH
jgi:hypothetical protein